jgi:hypothetical protein
LIVVKIGSAADLSTLLDASQYADLVK